MIRTIYKLGDYYLKENDSFLEGLSVPISLSKDKEQYLIVIDLNTSDRKIEITPYQMSDKTYMKFRYIGAADGAASPQWYGTVRNVGYLLGQTIPNLLEKWNQNDAFYEELKQALEIFFIDFAIKKSSERRYQYIFDPQFFNEKLVEKDNKKALKEVTKQFEKYLKTEKQINPKDVLLYSLSLNGKLIVNLKEYEDLVIQEKLNVFSNKKGICAVTNKEDLITGETTKLKFNYYINDKISFASYLDKKNYVKNMSIGKEAYIRIMVGESYILRQFNTRFNSLPCLVIPEFLFDFDIEDDIPFLDFSNHIMNLVYTVQTLSELENLERDVNDYIDYSGIENHVTLNFMFYTKAQAAMKISKFLANVPINHLKYLQKVMLEMEKVGVKFFGNGSWKLGLNNLYYLIPMKEKSGDNFEKRKILLLYESLLTNKEISYDWLIQQFLILAKIHMYEHYNVYQVRGSKDFSNDMLLVFDMLRAQLLLKMLKQLNLIKKGGENSVDYQFHDESLVGYMKEMSFNESQSAMFLLGVLIARVATTQVLREKGNNESRNFRASNKPILNKINFQGMNKIRLQMLSVDVFEKLRQNKILNSTNELVYAEHKRLFDKNIGRWNLSDRENVFYLLSGYSFGTKNILSRNPKKDKEEVR